MIHATVQTLRVVFTISEFRAASCRIILLFYILVVPAMTCHAQGRVTIPLDGLWLIEPFAGAIAAPIGQESERLNRDFCFAWQSVTRALPSLIRAPHTAASPRSRRRLIAKPPESSLRSGPPALR